MAAPKVTNAGRQMYGMASRIRPKITTLREFLHQHPDIGFGALIASIGLVGLAGSVTYQKVNHKEMTHVYKKEYLVIRPEARKKEYRDEYYNLPK